MADPRDVLTVENLRAYYKVDSFGTALEVRAVDDVSLSVRRNEIYGIAGESSSGKTSLIKTLAAAIRPPLQVVGGKITYRFGDLVLDPYQASKAEVDAIRWRNLSYIMQGSMSVLNPVKKVRHAFRTFAIRPMGLPKDQFWNRVEAHLARLGLPATVLDSYPHQLSGGMRQRVTIGLATVCEPQFVIADEPTTALDVVVQKDVLATIRDVQRRMGSSVIFVTHDMAVHANIADRVGIVYAGRLVEDGPTRELFTRPKHPYTAHLVASLPQIGDRSPKAALGGKPPNLADPPSGCRFHPRCPLAIDKCQREAPPLTGVGEDHRSACWRSDEVARPDAITPDRAEVAG